LDVNSYDREFKKAVKGKTIKTSRVAARLAA